jgi:hypothetical protein
MHVIRGLARENRRLDSWKEIASFFDRDERTVKRWEKEKGLPVHFKALFYPRSNPSKLKRCQRLSWPQRNARMVEKKPDLRYLHTSQLP